MNPTSAESESALDNPVGDDVDAVALRLKKQARRRLIGAIALALFGVITLPMIMDSQPRPVAPEIQVHIPSQDGPGLTGKVIPGAAVKSTPLPIPTVAPKGELPISNDTLPKEARAPVPGAKEGAQTEVEAKQNSAAATSKATQKPAPTEGVPVDRASASKAKPAAEKVVDAIKKSGESAAPATQREDEPRALAALTGTESLSAPWHVQLGAYKEAGNVKVLVTKVKEMKLPVTTEKFESSLGPRVRVKAGPFANRADAEKAQARIRTIGVVGVLSQ